MTVRCNAYALLLCLFVVATGGGSLLAQTASLPVQYEELTAPDFVKAVQTSGSTCIIPMGIIEKHGPHLPLGTDMLDSRQVALRAARKEYTIIFPPYYFGQIYEARHQPGTLAYSPELVWNMLQETCDELSRNGIKKIIIVNGHGGNNSLLPYFCQAQLQKKKDYAVILFQPARDPEQDAKISKMRKTRMEMHAGEMETSTVMAHRPDLAHPDRAKDQNGEDQARLRGFENGYTAIWWYARFPNHYAGDGTPGNAELGNALLDAQAEQLAKLIADVKKNDDILKLQEEFYKEAENPLATRQ